MAQLSQTVADHYKRRALGDLILNALKAAGKDINHLTPDDLAPVNEFHSGSERPRRDSNRVCPEDASR
jgi:hypothetical protein